MATNAHAGLLPTWVGPEQCPFCEASLADGGPAFVEHVGTNPDCAAAFETWRSRVSEDIPAGWSG